jgi:dienelactone hydrolase
MAELIMFHHAQGLTRGVEDFADALRAAGHGVTVPDLYEGATFATLEEGVAHAEQVGFEEIIARGVSAAEGLPEGIVYAGFSLGVLPAQKLAQTRPGALGALLYHEGLAASVLGESWPETVALQVHVAEQDEWVEMEVTRGLVAGAADGELFVYPGSAHLFTDSSLDAFLPEAAELVLRRSIEFLDRLS